MKFFSSSVIILTFLLLLLTSGGLAAQERGLQYKVGASAEEVSAGRTPQLWGVVIGVSQYQKGDVEQDGNTIPNLKYAHDDAQHMYDFLRSEAGGGFKDRAEGGHLILLKDEAATYQAVKDALAYLKQARPEDYFIIYIAAHGVLLPERNEPDNTTKRVPYFVLHDTNLQAAPNTALRMDDLPRLVREFKAQKGLVLSDTCHSAGVLLAGRGLRTNIEANAWFLEAMKKIPAGVGFISASDAEESSYERPQLLAGIFTWNLLAGLRGDADTDHNGIVTFKEIKSYLRIKVPEMTERNQNPTFSVTSLEANDIPLARVSYAKALTPAVTSPTASPTTAAAYGLLVIRVPDIDGVEVSINDARVGVLSSALEQSIKVPAGPFKLRLTKGRLRHERQDRIAAGESKPLEVNLSFTQEEGESIIEPSEQSQTTIYLQDTEQPQPEAHDLFQTGVDRFQKQLFSEAIELLNRAIHANGGLYAAALVYRGRAEQALGQKEAAVNSYQTALNQRPSDFETRTLLAEAKLNQGRVQEAYTELQAVIKRHPKFAFARVVLADVLLLRPDLMSAERELRYAIQLDANAPPAYLILAEVLTSHPALAKQKEAVEMAAKALQLFETLARKQVSLAKGVRSLSLSHIIFGGARYANKAALAEAHQVLAKTLNSLVERNDNVSDAERVAALSRAQTHIQAALRLSNTFMDKRRSVLTLETSARNALLRGDFVNAIKEAEQSLKIGKTLASLQGYAEAHYTLYSAFSSQQAYARAADQLKTYIAIMAPKLPPTEVQRLQEEWEQMQRQADAHRKKK